jgi:hypothetical protein
MGIYKRIIDLEIEVVKFHKNFIMGLQPIIDQSEKRLDILRVYGNIQHSQSSRQNLSLMVLTKKIGLLR